MTTFLERILATKQEEVQRLRSDGVQADLSSLAALPPARGFAAQLQAGDRLTVVAEVKQASPSKGLIATDFRPAQTAQAYAQAGAAAVSVLTDESYFRGSMQDLAAVRRTVQIPVLRKDFIIDELQVAQARLAGADAVLLICAALAAQRLAELSAFARAAGLDVLIEVHHVREVDAALAAKPSILGVNNRDLRTFEVRLETTEEVAKQLPKGLPFIAESAILTRSDALRMAACGATGILVGEALMRCQDPREQAQLLESLQVLRPRVTATDTAVQPQ